MSNQIRINKIRLPHEFMVRNLLYVNPANSSFQSEVSLAFIGFTHRATRPRHRATGPNITTVTLILKDWFFKFAQYHSILLGFQSKYLAHRILQPILSCNPEFSNFLTNHFFLTKNNHK